MEHDRIVGVSPTRNWRGGLSFELRRDGRYFPHAWWQRRAVRLRDGFDQIAVGHADRSLTIVVDRQPEKLVVVEAEDDLLDRISLYRCRSTHEVWPAPLQLLYHRRTPMEGLGLRRRNASKCGY